MDPGIVAFLTFAAAVVAGAVFFARPKAVVPLEEMLARLASISGNAKLTAVQKRHEAEVAYRAYQDRIVSLIGVVDDVFPNGSVTMRTSSRDLPAVGMELTRVSNEQLRQFMKGKAITLRVKLPDWRKFTDVADLAPGFHGARAFFAGRWYPVKATYRVRPPQPGTK